ncbi:MAG TPA: cyclic nucleotide-binding domain-containing protein [Candidatus Sulfotelmatobacter sp.]|nr:cyclic nucleotide-binding domain-containing protein [Candidatus Sulfotelmatobacter sp.]
MAPEKLKKIAVLQAMDSTALTRLAEVLEEQDCVEGKIVFAEGDPGDSMYFILQGHIRIEKPAQTTGAPSKTLAVLEAGDYFGEMALLDQKPRSASAVAAGTTALLRLSKASFDDMQRDSRAAALRVLFAMLCTASERIRRLSAHLVVYEEVGKTIGEAPELQTLLDVILQQLSSAIGADWGLLLLRPQFSEGFELRSQLNLTLTTDQREALNQGEGFFGLLLRDPQNQIVASCDEQEPFSSCRRLGFETPSLLVAPITLESQFLGLLLLGGRQREQFDLNALNLARGVARQAASAILNARHREEEQARSRHARQYVHF